MPIYFKSPSEFRRWLEKNASREIELLVGFHKKHTGAPSMTWPESVDQALCFGWIDAIRRSVDDSRYTIRFTPRKPTSTWSAINIKRVATLKKLGLMMPAGLKAFAARREHRSGIYAYEQRSTDLPAPSATIFKRNKKAWSYYQKQPPSYKQRVNWWVVSAKQEATRERRLATLIEVCAEERWLPQYVPKRAATKAK